MSYNARKFYPAVREMCDEEGWEVWFTYSDKRKYGRRVAFAQAGRPVPEKTKEKILKRLRDLMDEYGVKGKPYWTVSFKPGYGDYDKLCIAISN